MGIRQTHTYVELEISKAAYDEIATKLRAAGYGHAFMDDGCIDMHGIAVVNFVKKDGSEPDARGHQCLQPEPFFQCPDCGGDLSTLGHTSDCPKKAY